MKLKTFGALLVMILTASGAIAVGIMEFPGWKILKERSKDIILVRCNTTPDPYNVFNKDGIRTDIEGGLIDSDIRIMSVLKGTTNSGNVRLNSKYWPRQGEYYLIFAQFHDGFYTAVETYRIVPLGPIFVTNILAGKSLDEQIETAFELSADYLNRQIRQEQEQKKRLEEGVRK